MTRAVLILFVLTATIPAYAAPGEAVRYACPETGSVVILYGPENQPSVMRIGGNATMLAPSSQEPGRLYVSRMHGWREHEGTFTLQSRERDRVLKEETCRPEG